MGDRSRAWRIISVVVLALTVVQSRESTHSSPVAPVTPSAPTTTVYALPFAGPGTVGHRADVPGFNVPAYNLTPHPGDYTTTRDGEIIEAMDIGGSVVVRNRGVIIRRNRIGLGVITLRGASAWVAWNTIGPVNGYESQHVSGNGRGENLIFYRNEIFGGVDLFNFYNSGDITIQENWAYGAYQELRDPYQLDQTPTTSHSDGIQVHMGGAHYHVIRNRFDLFLFRGYRWSGAPNRSQQVPITPRPTARDRLGKIPNIAPMTTGFLFQQTNGPLDDIVFDGNRIDGDFYRAFSFEKGRYGQSATNVRIVNNTIVRRYPKFGRNQLVGADTYSNITFDNNVDERGNAIPRPPGTKAAAAKPLASV